MSSSSVLVGRADDVWSWPKTNLNPLSPLRAGFWSGFSEGICQSGIFLKSCFQGFGGFAPSRIYIQLTHVIWYTVPQCLNLSMWSFGVKHGLVDCVSRKVACGNAMLFENALPFSEMSLRYGRAIGLLKGSESVLKWLFPLLVYPCRKVIYCQYLTMLLALLLIRLITTDVLCTKGCWGWWFIQTNTLIMICMNHSSIKLNYLNTQNQIFTSLYHCLVKLARGKCSTWVKSPYVVRQI